ncbi:hypothetical protein K466DRAFT_117700 [Polyporus arcularius HHB13444]|uniref:Uncharacterized protein n=1 Tax=Polyporus arcularius HHB13444 TaxID=1314778 RepID=A0A5C3PF92_9APHY|nr:hypothetical protein K466DRAFT_117700 [Polyporus arcularius HHB13444]
MIVRSRSIAHGPDIGTAGEPQMFTVVGPAASSSLSSSSCLFSSTSCVRLDLVLRGNSLHRLLCTRQRPGSSRTCCADSWRSSGTCRSGSYVYECGVVTSRCSSYAEARARCMRALATLCTRRDDARRTSCRCVRLVSRLTTPARVCDSLQTVLRLQTTAHLAGSWSKFHPMPAILLVTRSRPTLRRLLDQEKSLCALITIAPTADRDIERLVVGGLRGGPRCGAESILWPCPVCLRGRPKEYVLRVRTGQAVDFALKGSLTCTLRLRLSCGTAVRLVPGPEGGEARCLAPAKAGTLLLGYCTSLAAARLLRVRRRFVLRWCVLEARTGERVTMTNRLLARVDEYPDCSG